MIRIVTTLMLIGLYSSPALSFKIKRSDKVAACKPLNAVPLTTQIIDLYLDQRVGHVILPAPAGFCANKNLKVSFIDEAKNVVATATILESWEGKLKMPLLIGQLPERSLPKQYNLENMKIGMNSNSTTDYLLKSMFRLENLELKTNLALFRFKYEVDPRYKLRFTSYDSLRSSPHARLVNYNQLLELYGKSKPPQIVHVLTTKNEWHRMPGFKKDYKRSDLERSLLLNLSEFIHYIRGNELSTLDLDEPIVVTSRSATSNGAYNLIEELSFLGAKKIYWFNDLEFDFFNIKPLARSVPSNVLISADQAIKEVSNKKAIFVDIRKQHEHRLSRIPNSYSVPSVLDSRGYNNLRYTPLPKDKRLILVHNNFQNESFKYLLNEAKRLLEKNWGHKDIVILDGGMSELYKATKWNYPSLTPDYLPGIKD